MTYIIIPVVVLGLIGLSLGLFLAFASKKFEVKLDPNVEKILSVLPGVNCGACGYPGCSGYAEAVSKGDAEINLCAPGGVEVVSEISSIMGLDAVETGEKKVARVFCQGDNSKTKKNYDFQGKIESCHNAMLYFGGDKSCGFGCLGYGDCVSVCPFDAIKINEKGIAIVDEEKCTACNKCVKACPKNVIKILPKSSRVSVLCTSKDAGAIARKVCEVSCIACGLCQKACPVDAIEIKNNLAIINPEKCINCGICALKCPTNAIKDDIKEIKKAEIIEEKCIGCTACKRVCPVDAIEGEVKKKHNIIYEKCVGCGLCLEKCKFDAIKMTSKIKKI